MNPVRDAVLEGFLDEQLRNGSALAAASDIFDFLPLAPNRYILHFHCTGLVWKGLGQIEEADRFDLGIYFAPDYLSVARPAEVVTWLAPLNVHHPNVLGPMVCIGTIDPGTGVVDLAFRLYDLVRYELWASHDALNPDAAQFARNNVDRFPLDRRPLKRRPPAPRPSSKRSSDKPR